MAKAKQVHTCRSCNTDLLVRDQAVCHNCGYRLNFDGDTKFNTPDYLFYQRGDLVIELDSKDRNYNSNIQAIDSDVINFLKKSDPEDKIASLYDSFYHLKSLILSEADSDTLKQAVKMGKLIGKLSNSIEDYAKNQGALNVSRGINPTGSEYDEENI